MNRRTFLLVAGGTTAALAGCTAPVNNSPTPTETPDPDLPTDPGTGTTLPFTITEIEDTLPEDVDFDVSVTNDDLMQGPPTFTITLTNNGDTQYRFAGERPALYIGSHTSVDDEATSFVLIPPAFFEETDAEYERDGAVWTSTSGYFQTQELRIGTIEAGKTVSSTVHLLQNADGPAEEYPEQLSFDAQFMIGETDLMQNGQQVTSMFTITFTSETDPAA